MFFLVMFSLFSSELQGLAEPGGGIVRLQTGVAQTGFDLLCEAFKMQTDRECFSQHHLLLVLPSSVSPLLYKIYIESVIELTSCLSKEPLELTRGSAAVALGFNEWHLKSVCLIGLHMVSVHVVIHLLKLLCSPSPHQKITFFKLDVNVSKRCT